MRPGVLGGLLTILSKILAILPTVRGTYTGGRERFVAFVELGLALEQVMDWERGTFLRVVGETLYEAHKTAIESSPVGQAIQNFMNIHEIWSGTMASLLTQLKLQVEESVARSKFFPQDSTRLAKALLRLSPDLKATGIEIENRKSNGVKVVALVKRAKIATLRASIKPSNLYGEGLSVRVPNSESSDPDPIASDPVLNPSDSVRDPALNLFIERVSEIHDVHRIARVAKNGAVSPDAKTDLGEWEITEEISEYEYIADDE